MAPAAAGMGGSGDVRRRPSQPSRPCPSSSTSRAAARSRRATSPTSTPDERKDAARGAGPARASAPSSSPPTTSRRLVDDPAEMTDLPAAQRDELVAALLPDLMTPLRTLGGRQGHHPQDAVEALRRRARRVGADALPRPGHDVRLQPGRLRHGLPVLRHRPGRPAAQHVDRRDRRAGRRRRPVAGPRRGRPAARVGSPTWSSWAWASRWPTTRPSSAPYAGSPTRRPTGSACPPAASPSPPSAWCRGCNQLAEEGIPVTLALSLHAPDDELRNELVPINTRFSVAETVEAAWNYAAQHQAPGLHRVRHDARHQRPGLARRPARRRAQLVRRLGLGARQPDPAQPDAGLEVDRLATPRTSASSSAGSRPRASRRPSATPAAARSTAPAASSPPPSDLTHAPSNAGRLGASAATASSTVSTRWTWSSIARPAASAGAAARPAAPRSSGRGRPAPSAPSRTRRRSSSRRRPGRSPGRCPPAPGRNTIPASQTSQQDRLARWRCGSTSRSRWRRRSAARGRSARSGCRARRRPSLVASTTSSAARAHAPMSGRNDGTAASGGERLVERTLDCRRRGTRRGWPPPSRPGRRRWRPCGRGPAPCPSRAASAYAGDAALERVPAHHADESPVRRPTPRAPGRSRGRAGPGRGGRRRSGASRDQA